MNRFKSILFLFVAALLIAACVWNDEVQPNEVGQITDAGRHLRCVGPGLQNEGGFYTGLSTYRIDPMTFNVINASVATKDTQIVSVEITVQARRKADCPATQALYTKWASMLDDQNVVNAVSAVAAQAIKSGVRNYTLNGLLDDRDGLGLSILSELLEQPIAEVIEFISVAVPNVDVDDTYEALLQERNNLREQVNVEAQRQAVIQQEYANRVFEQEQAELALIAQLEREKAQTAVDVEIATRQGDVTEAQNAIYETNQQAFELRRLQLLKDVFNNKTVIIVPENSDLNLFANQTGGQPVIVEEATP